MNGSPRYNPTARADVCLLLEGTWPYVRGGVSTWVKQLIEGMPELSFSVVYLGASADDHDQPAYPIPDNVVHIERHFLLSADTTEPATTPFWKRAPKRAATFATNQSLHDTLRDIGSTGAAAEGDAANDASHATPGGVLAEAFTRLLTGPDALTESDLQQHEGAWTAIRERYQDAPPGLDFNHFFWTVRSMHAPLFTLASIVEHAPQATVYHSVSTGYAGWLGAMLAKRTGQPYLISEHGIYTKERELDLAQVDWIPDSLDPYRVALDDGMGYLRQVWIRFFRSLGRMAYASADHTFTLYNGNRIRQIADGADESKLTIIPNGVDVARFATSRRSAGSLVPPVLALIGRVVPIKDIKTFIRAMRIIRSEIPEAQGWLVGPQDEDPGYARECMALVKSLDLDDTIHFLGFQKPEDILPTIGLSVLTSVSEGQPLTVLEGFAAGIPAVTTDVGSCRELIHGTGDDDVSLGAAGAVVPMANPEAFATAALALLGDDQAWQRASCAAIARVERYYDETDMINRYRDEYRQAMAAGDGRAASDTNSVKKAS